MDKKILKIGKLIGIKQPDVNYNTGKDVILLDGKNKIDYRKGLNYNNKEVVGK